MKKFLSLVLALVMTMSLVTVSAGAKDFDDNGDIDYKEAVDVISALGIVDGYSDGSFRPDGSLTRGAAGPTTASALSASTAPFKDVPTTNVFAGYITYCAQRGIISGYGDGTFRPTGTLTGNAFMKMLLGALGYDSSIEGYTGSNWQVNVTKQAIGIGLEDGNDEFVGSKAVTRQEAALYSFNMLKADMVQYDSKTTVDINGATVTIAGDKAEAVSTSNGWAGTNDGNIERDNVQQFAEKYFDKLTKTRNDTDPFGRPANEWKYRSEIIGSYADYSDLLETYTAKASKGDLYGLLGSSIVNGLDDGDYDLTVYVDGKEVSKPVVKDYFVKNSSSAAGVSGNGVLTEIFMDDDNNVTLVFVNTYLVKATADYNSNRESLSIETVDINTDTDEDDNPITVPSLGTTIDNEDVPVSSFKEDDYILVTYSYATKEIESAQLAEVVTGEVSEFTETTEVIMDGTTYKYNNLVGKTESRTEYTIGEDAKVVLDAYGYIIYIDEALSTNSYVFVKETAKATGVGNKVAADVYFTDGTNDSVILKKVAGKTDFDSKNGAEGFWWTYSKDSNNQYTLNSVKAPLTADVKGTITTTSSEIEVIKNDAIRFMPNVDGSYDKDLETAGTQSANVNTVKGDSSTIFVVLEADGDVTAYTGVSNAPDVKSGTTTGKTIEVYAVVKTTTGYAQYVFVDLSNDPGATVEDSNTAADYLFLLKYTGNKTTSGEDTYYKYKVVYDGVETEKYVESSLVDGGDSNGLLFRDVKENAKGYVTGAEEFEDSGKRDVIDLEIASNDQITYSNDTLTIAGNGYIITSETNVTLAFAKNANEDLVNEGDDYTLYQGSARGVASQLKGYKLDGTAYIAVDDTGSEVATDIYIWVAKAEATEEVGGGSGDAGDFEYSVSVAKNGNATIRITGFVWPEDGKQYESAEITFDLVDEDGNVVDQPTVTIEYPKTSITEVVTGTGYDNTDVLTIDEETIEVTPKEATVESITVNADEAKTEYSASEALDTTDVVVTATYTNGEEVTVDIADCTVTVGSDADMQTGDVDSLTTTDTTVKVEYEGQSDTYTITVA